MRRLGTLCTGYGGLDLAVEGLLGTSTSWLCEFNVDASRLLDVRFPGVPNHHDLKALTWAEHPVEVLTAGYPCQPFSGAGLRLGTDDPRHLFPWIAQGIERMRPPLVLLENVRGHLSLGFGVVLAELNRLGYDVRWTLLRAADVGAPHNRARLWIAARAREVGGWPAPAGDPSAIEEGGEWVTAQGGLFGHVPADKPGGRGAMVGGLRWDRHVDEPRGREFLFATPDTAPEHKNAGSHQRRQPAGLGNQVALLPTPMSSLGRGTGTPSVQTAYERQVLQHKRNLDDAVALLPTPRTGPNRASRGALTGTGPGCDNGAEGQWSAPGLEQALELARGELPREYESWEEVRGAHAALLPTPAVNDDMGKGKTVEWWDAWTAEQKAKHGNGNGHGPSLHIEAARLALLPTPATTDANGARNATSGRKEGSEHHSGTTLGDVVYTGAWGPYAVAVARWEALTRPAPSPTEAGKNGPRLSPVFVEWMQGLQQGWVTDPSLGLTRNAQLTLLGNGVVPQAAHAAFALLLADLLAGAVAA